MIGPEPSDSRARTVSDGGGHDNIIQEGRVLNRVIRWTKDGWEIEPDQRHADIIVHELGFHDSKPVSTPGEMDCRNEHGYNRTIIVIKDTDKFLNLQIIYLIIKFNHHSKFSKILQLEVATFQNHF